MLANKKIIKIKSPQVPVTHVHDLVVERYQHHWEGLEEAELDVDHLKDTWLKKVKLWVRDLTFFQYLNDSWCCVAVCFY